MSDKCGKCGMPIHKAETGVRHMGTTRAHSEGRCIELLRDQLTTKDRKIADLQRLCERAYIEIHANFDRLTDEEGYGPQNLEADLLKAADGKEHRELQTLNDELGRAMGEALDKVKSIEADVEAAWIEVDARQRARWAQRKTAPDGEMEFENKSVQRFILDAVSDSFVTMRRRFKGD